MGVLRAQPFGWGCFPFVQLTSGVGGLALSPFVGVAHFLGPSFARMILRGAHGEMPLSLANSATCQASIPVLLWARAISGLLPVPWTPR